MSNPMETAATNTRIPPPSNRVRGLFATHRLRSLFAINRTRRLLAIDRVRILFAINGIRCLLAMRRLRSFSASNATPNLFGSLGSCGFRVLKSGIRFFPIRPWVAPRAHIGAEMDEFAMNPANQPPATPPPVRLPISDSPLSPFHFVETIVDVRCYPGVTGEPRGIVRVDYFYLGQGPDAVGAAAEKIESRAVLGGGRFRSQSCSASHVSAPCAGGVELVYVVSDPSRERVPRGPVASMPPFFKSTVSMSPCISAA